MSGRIFLDTNILVYAVDTADAAKQQRAQSILAGSASEYRASSFVVSTQVLQEFYVTVTRKLVKPMPAADAQEAVRILMRLTLVQVDGELILEAIESNRKQSLSFWDALIVHSAIRSGCRLLLSEDLGEGQVFQKTRIRNPFRRSS